MTQPPGQSCRPFRVLIMIGGFDPGYRGGGPVRTVVSIVDSASDRVAVTVVTRDRDLGQAEPYPGLSGRRTRRVRATVFYLDIRRVTQWWRLWRWLRTEQFDLLYVNSLWAPIFTVIPVVASRLRLIRTRAVLLAPRGELAPEAMAHRSWKKRLFLSWWGRYLRRADVTWHASSDLEAAQIRAACPWARIETVLDQFTLPEQPLPLAVPSGVPARFVYIGRIARLKNLDVVLAAMRGVTQPVDFHIYGPAEDRRYWQECKGLMAQLPAHVRVAYRGELLPDRVPETFSGYDAFLFPTKGENFGHVVAESLSASCPVVCTDRTWWTALLDAGGGVVVPAVDVTAWREVIDRLAATDPVRRTQARRMAGEVYRAWRAQADSPNILDRMRESRAEGGTCRRQTPRAAPADPGTAGHGMTEPAR